MACCCVRPNKLGVIVWASESVEENEGCRRIRRTGEVLRDLDRDVRGEDSRECTV